MNKEQKKDMYLFYLKAFLVITVLYFFMWLIPDPVAKALSVCGFSLSTIVTLSGLVKTYKGKW
jgi:hypothetical protein